jgi:HPt (histidine-containing phosphotransfer) domain-containing protein
MKDPADSGEDSSRLAAMLEQQGAAAPPPSVLDALHLERQVFGDRQLREELLRLYAGRLLALAPAVCAAPGPERREAAHTLKGASLAIGAFALASLCDRLENHEGEGARQENAREDGARQEDTLKETALMIEATRRRVAELLRPGD